MSKLIRPTLPASGRGGLNDPRSTGGAGRGGKPDVLAVRGTAPVRPLH